MGKRVEALFYSYNIFEKDKVQLVIESFTSSVLDWWKYIREYWLRNGCTPITSWGLMKDVLRDKFGILDHEEEGTTIRESCTFLHDECTKKEEESEIEEKREVEKGSIVGELCIVESTSTSFEECEYEKTAVSAKEIEGEKKGIEDELESCKEKPQEIKCSIENYESLKEE